MSALPSDGVKSQPTIRVELVTPVMATQMLEGNTFNRNLREAVVDAYTRDITSGNWHFNGDPIRIANDGTLLDGQHRLHAIAAAGIAVRMVVMRGLSAHQQNTMDTGLKRNLGDTLKLRGEQYAPVLAGLLRSVALSPRLGKDSSKIVVTTSSLLQLLDDNPWLRDGVTLLRKVQMTAKLPVSVSGGLWYLFMQLDPNDATDFFKRLASDEGHYSGEPIYALRKVLMQSSEGAPRTVRLPARTAAAFTIKAWNAYRTGEHVQQLRFVAGGSKPEAFPQPR